MTGELWSRTCSLRLFHIKAKELGICTIGWSLGRDITLGSVFYFGVCTPPGDGSPFLQDIISMLAPELHL